jgi:uncharacterized protein
MKVSRIFVNLPVKDLDKSVKFFTKLGFKFNPKFTDKRATCMIIGKDMYAMLLIEKLFRTFTKKASVNAKKNAEVLISLNLESRYKVDEMVDKAIKAGGKVPRGPDDLGYMYQRSFLDMDGHQWEPFYMDLSKFPKKR